MSLLEIFRLVVSATGAALHLYLAWAIRVRRGFKQLELLCLSLGVWFLGNLLVVLHELLLGEDRLAGWMAAWQAMMMLGVSFVPSALLDAHLAAWSVVSGRQQLRPRAALYAPLLALPYAVYLISGGAREGFFDKLRPLLMPYSIWFVAALWSSAALDLAIRSKLDREAARERAFLRSLAILLVATGAFEFLVVALGRPDLDDPLWIAYLTLSLMPTLTAAYYVYRYKIVDVAVKDSLVYACFALIFIAIYNYVIRWLDELLVARYGIRAGVVQAILILGMVALAGPLVRLLDGMVQRFFSREMGLYGELARQISAGAASFSDLSRLARYIEQVICQNLNLDARIILDLAEGPAARLARRAEELGAGIIEDDEDVRALGASAVCALRREGKLIGLMQVSAGPGKLTSEKRQLLDVLAGQIATELETCRITEEKMRLERELERRERLAALGQMAAAVAHEVKNPLSSIKSIAQVMHKELQLTPYERDLELIIGEIDRLNRTVSQLLAFSTPSNQSPSISLSELINSTVEMLKRDAMKHGVSLSADPAGDVQLNGKQAAALKEALMNLVLNSIQAMPDGGEVKIEAAVEGRTLTISVTDTGPGIASNLQERIFEPFYTTKPGGVGLGLAIVRSRAVELGGSVRLISPVSEGRGARFQMSIPLES